MNFNSEEIAFLEKYNISHEKVFDAMGMRKSVWTELISGGDYALAHRTTPCKKYGHTLRTRAGHCAQCNPANMNYQGRYHEKRNLYLAQSLRGDIFKVGISKNLKEINKTLNSQMYAGEWDWLIIWSECVDDAGRVEAAVKKMLAPYAVEVEHIRGGQLQKTTETFRSKKDLIVELIKRVVARA